LLAPPTTLETSTLAGSLAALIFLGPAMAFFFAKLDNVAGLKRLASLLLHRDEFVAEAVPLLDTAIRRAPDEASLYDRRALAHALGGNLGAAEADWARHLEFQPKSNAPDVARGWVALRGGRSEEAGALFTHALSRSKCGRSALVGLGVSRMKQGDAQGAAEALARISPTAHNALSMTYLAEARLAAGDACAAEEDATVAISEMDSIHGRSWMVRAAARRELGDIDGAAKDYNNALSATDEPGIEDRAMAGLEEIDRPVRDEDYDDDEYVDDDDEVSSVHPAAR
jgi:Tfp pilus assembly protein PilF